MSHSARGGGRLNPNETLSHSNGKFVFDHGPNVLLCIFLGHLEYNEIDILFLHYMIDFFYVNINGKRALKSPNLPLVSNVIHLYHFCQCNARQLSIITILTRNMKKHLIK